MLCARCQLSPCWRWNRVKCRWGGGPRGYAAVVREMYTPLEMGTPEEVDAAAKQRAEEQHREMIDGVTPSARKLGSNKWPGTDVLFTVK